jgi:tetratricopeptide (TPR) repeat protein
MSLNNLSNRLSDLGRREEALANSAEAVRIRRQLAEERPDVFLPHLATSLNNLSIGLGDLGRNEEALANAEEAVRIRRKLAEKRPDVFRPQLAASLNTLANRLSDLGRREDALLNAEEAVGIYRQVAETRPDAFLARLAQALGALGNILSAYRPGQALAPYAAAIRILTPFFARLPDAHSPLMQAIRSRYLQAAQAAGVSPDPTLLPAADSIFEKVE